MSRLNLFFAAILTVACAFIVMPSAARSEDTLQKIENEVEGLKKENSELKKRVETLETGKKANAPKLEDAELKKRVENLETDAEEIKHNYAVHTSLVDVSGYADAEFRLTDRHGANNRFRIHHLSLFFTKDIQKDWKFFSEVEFEDAPRINVDNGTHALDTTDKVNGGILFVEQMYLEYHPAYEWDIRAGRVLTPIGIWSIYHYPPYVPFQTHPLFFKNIFPETSDGAQARASFNVGDSILDTHVVVSNGSGNPGGTDNNPNKAVGLRLNMAFVNGLSLGTSYFRDKDNNDVMKNLYGLHLLFNYGPFKLQSEYLLRHNRPAGRNTSDDNAWYGYATYDIGKWTLAGRLDWYNHNNNILLPSTAPRPGQKRYTAALNYHFAHNVVGKAEYDRYISADSGSQYTEVVLAIAVAMGDL